jgi:hypothetical protein
MCVGVLHPIANVKIKAKTAAILTEAFRLCCIDITSLGQMEMQI